MLGGCGVPAAQHVITSREDPMRTPVGVTLRRALSSLRNRVGDAEHVLVVVPRDLLLGHQLAEGLLERRALLVEGPTEVTRLSDVTVQRSDVGSRPHLHCPMFTLQVAEDAPLGAVDLVPVRSELLGCPPHAGTTTRELLPNARLFSFFSWLSTYSVSTATIAPRRALSLVSG